MKIEFSTHQFVRSHGKEPKGRGSYAFHIEGDVPDAILWSPSMTLGDAKKWARTAVPERLKLVGAELKMAYVDILP
jgi:hypothetical protein